MDRARVFKTEAEARKHSANVTHVGNVWVIPETIDVEAVEVPTEEIEPVTVDVQGDSFSHKVHQ